MSGAWVFHRRVEEKPELGRRVRARVSSVESQNFRFSRSADEEADRAARALIRRSRSQNLRRRVDDFPKKTEARGGAWQGFG